MKLFETAALLAHDVSLGTRSPELEKTVGKVIYPDIAIQRAAPVIQARKRS